MTDTPYQPAERRPIAARGWRVFVRTASWLARRGVSPNAISLAGMGCGVAAGVALAATAAAPEWGRVAWLAAAVLIQARLLANLLDGMVAVEAGRASRLGELYNEVPDRVSDAAILVGLGYAQGSEPVLGYVAALLAMFTAYVRAMGKVAGAPQFYQGPMAKPHRMWVVTVLCVCTGVAPHTPPVALPGGGLTPPTLVLALIILGCAATVVRRLILIRKALREPTSCTPLPANACSATSTPSNTR